MLEIGSEKGEGGSWGQLPPFVARGMNRENSYCNGELATVAVPVVTARITPDWSV